MKKMIDVSEDCVQISKKGLKAVVEPRGRKIDRISSNVTYKDFFESYLLVNKPCIISQEMTANWKSVQNWVDCESGGPNFQYLKENFGNV
jgi:virulence-associated protein VagC